jgi:large subunit ribosomal protein L10
MDNPRPGKVAVVDEVRDKLRDASAAILTEYRGLTVGDLSTLRRSLREAGGEYRIYKNTLVRFAARDLGLDSLEALLVGPTAIAFVEGDAVTVAKTLRDYARTNPNLVVKGGILGTAVLTASDAAALADIPPREVLLARFAGLLAAPMQQFAGLLQALPRNFAYGLKALIEKSGGVPEPEPEAEPQAAPPEPEPEAEALEPEAAPPSEPEAAASEPESAEATAAATEPEPAPADEAPVASAAPEAEPTTTDESQDQE